MNRKCPRSRWPVPRQRLGAPTFFTGTHPCIALRCKLPPYHYKPPKTSKNIKTAASHLISTLPSAQSRVNRSSRHFKKTPISTGSHSPSHSPSSWVWPSVLENLLRYRRTRLIDKETSLSSRLLLTYLSHVLGQAHHWKA